MIGNRAMTSLHIHDVGALESQVLQTSSQVALTLAPMCHLYLATNQLRPMIQLLERLEAMALTEAEQRDADDVTRPA